MPLSVLVTASTEAPGALDVEREIAAALELANAEHLAEAAFQIDVDELHMRGHRDPAVGAGDAERALGGAAERLRFADRQVELAVAHGGGDGGSAQLRVRDLDAGGGQPQIEVEIGEAVERDRQPVPVALVRGQRRMPET